MHKTVLVINVAGLESIIEGIFGAEFINEVSPLKGKLVKDDETSLQKSVTLDAGKLTRWPSISRKIVCKMGKLLYCTSVKVYHSFCMYINNIIL